VPTIEEYCRQKTKPIYWPLQALNQLWPRAKVSEFLGDLLEGMDNDYWRDPEKKVGLIDIAASHETERVSKALVQFIEDHHEDIRYSASTTLLSRDIDLAEIFAARLAGGEESLRVLLVIANGFAEKGWSLGDHTGAVAAKPPQGFKVNGGKLVAAK
jgi:hypothetical protein